MSPLNKKPKANEGMQYNQLKFELNLVKLFIVIKNIINKIKIIFESKETILIFNK